MKQFGKITLAVLSTFVFLFLFVFTPRVFAASPGDVVINEVYYDVDSLHGSETTNEWIELYNKSSSTIDVSEWIITDNNSTKTFPVGVQPLLPGGVLLVSPSDSTWTFWPIESLVAKIVLALGNGLSNTGDKLILKDKLGNEIDSLSYGTNIDIWNPAIEDVVEGHSIERNPGGEDTNFQLDFIDQETPTPGRIIAVAITPTSTLTSTPTNTATPTLTHSAGSASSLQASSGQAKTPTSTLTRSTSSGQAISSTPSIKDILGESTQSATITLEEVSPVAKEEINKKTEVLGENNFAKLAISAGIILIISCGILVFRSYLKRRNEIKNI